MCYSCATGSLEAVPFGMVGQAPVNPIAALWRYLSPGYFASLPKTAPHTAEPLLGHVAQGAVGPRGCSETVAVFKMVGGYLPQSFMIPVCPSLPPRTAAGTQTASVLEEQAPAHMALARTWCVSRGKIIIWSWSQLIFWTADHHSRKLPSHYLILNPSCCHELWKISSMDVVVQYGKAAGINLYYKCLLRYWLDLCWSCHTAPLLHCFFSSTAEINALLPPFPLLFHI